MCGIYGYVGKREAAPIILEGLTSLEYRGYDSAGLAVVWAGGIFVRKEIGRISNLAKLVASRPVAGCTGIGHTRWATHGPPTRLNAHPHFRGGIAIVHNGVIENYKELKMNLVPTQFISDTDSEVLAHLIDNAYRLLIPGAESFLFAVKQALKLIVGSYAIAAICQDCPGVIVVACKGCPLLIARGCDGNVITSDVAALGPGSHNVCTLRDGDCEIVTEGFFPKQGHIVEVKQNPAPVGECRHETFREIHEQPHTIKSCLKNFDPFIHLRKAKRILLLGCGSSLHAALLGKHYFEQFAGIPVDVECASEFRYRKSPVDGDTAVVVLSQSGETADSLAAVRQFSGSVLAICNSPNSTLVREARQSILLDTGAPERGVAATKTFTAQVAALARLSHPQMFTELENLPNYFQEVLNRKETIRRIARKYAHNKSIFFLGRRYGYPTALEAALKLKELAYIHAEGSPAGEMKHGPLALVSEQTPCVFLLPPGDLYGKTVSNLQEVRARKAPVIAVSVDSNPTETEVDTIRLPEVTEPLFPIVASVALQLFAYYIAVELGCNIDRPRNLAKSVTVE